jgi:hypothetical protein
LSITSKVSHALKGSGIPYGQILRTTIVLAIANAASFFLTLHSAWAGPPFVTDDPEPVAHRHWEVNYAITKSWRQGEASAGMPSVDINYGIVPNIQLHVQPRYSYEKSTEGARYGIDDTEIGVKYRFLHIEHDDSSLMVGIYPIYLMPTGDTKLGPDRRSGKLLLPLWIQRDIGRWTYYGGPAYRINPGTGNKNSVFVGGTALYKATQSLQIGGEIFHETPDSVGGPRTTGFNLGGTYTLNHDYNLLFSAGKGLSNVSATNQFSFYLALQAHY